MITDEQVQASVDFLFDSADAVAKARAERATLSEGLKRIQAIEFMNQPSGAVDAKKMAALASDAYGIALDGLKEAIFEDEKMRALRDAHAARIEAWRTQEATKRSVRL
jgi:hypothetical protein